MQKPSRLIRTTLGEYLLSEEPYNGPGVYVLACYPSLGCLYIGLAKRVAERIRSHFSFVPSKSDTPLAEFIKKTMLDALRFRLDIHIPPGDDFEWCKMAERRLIAEFSPTFNIRGNV